MGRNRFVQPGIVRLSLADVHKRAHAALVKDGVEIAKETPTSKAKYREATAEEIAASARRVENAVEDGDWIEVKRELTNGEARRSFSKLVKEMHFNERAQVDPEQVGLAKVVEYLVAWSFVGEASDRFPDGEPIPVSESAIDNLDAASYGEIESAIDWHEEQTVKAREARKNGRGDGARSSQPSPSVA